MKNLLTISLLLFISGLHAQIKNAGFENWDSVRVLNYDTEAPSDWHLGYAGAFNLRKDTSAFEGNFALKIFGSYGAADGEIVGYVQQKLTIPSGLDSISFFAKTEFQQVFQPNWNFYGYGLHSDTISAHWQGLQPEDFVVGVNSKDSLSDYTRLSFAVPDSLEGREMYLTFYCRPINWGTIPALFVDDIQFEGNFTNGAQETDNQLISVFPNPTQDWIFIQNEGSNFSKIEIFSPEGKLIFSEKENNKINVNQLPAGSYFLVLRSEENGIIGSKIFLKN